MVWHKANDVICTKLIAKFELWGFVSTVVSVMLPLC